MSHEKKGALWAKIVRTYTSSVTDLLLIVAYVAIVDAAFVGTAPSSARALFGLPLLLFVPGYVVLAALFPRRVEALTFPVDDRPFATVSAGALRPLERVTLSFGVSIALLPVFGLVISWLGLGFQPTTLMGAVTATLLAGVVVAGVRRYQLPDGERFSVSPTAWFSRQLAALSDTSRARVAITVALVVISLLATSGLAYGLVAPGDGDTYTNVGLYAENDTGALVTSDYPTTLTRNETGDVVVEVENHEHQTVEYTLVAELQRVDRTGDTVTVEESVELDRSQRSLADGERWQSEQTIQPALVGDDLRVVYLLYRGTPPADPGMENAYRSVYLSVEVSE